MNNARLRLALVISLSSVASGSVAPWKIKPIEIIRGKKQLHLPFLTAEKQDFEKWQVWTNIRADLTKSSERRLWRDTVAKLTIFNSDNSRPGSVEIAPPRPMPIPGAFDSVDLWVHGPQRASRPDFFVKIRDSQGKTFVIRLLGGVCGAAFYRGWWAMGHAQTPFDVAFPAQFVSLIFKGITTPKPDAIYFDALSFYQQEYGPLTFPARKKLPFPATPNTILPTTYGEYRNTVLEDKGRYVFSYRGTDCTIKYVYTPRTGSLSDIWVEYGDGFSFQPTTGGGIVANVGGVPFAPQAGGLNAKLLGRDFNEATNELVTRWRWTKDGREIRFDLALRIKGKSLIVEAKSASRSVLAFRIGRSARTPEPKLLSVPFFDNRWSTPKILYTRGVFVSALLDWYESNASLFQVGEKIAAWPSALLKNTHNSEAPWLREHSKKAPSNLLDRTKVLDADSAVYNGGSLYLPKTNGERNPLDERLFITVSPRLAEVLPNIPNPPSRFGQLTAKTVFSTRMYPITKPEHLAIELSFWRKMKAYGLDHLLVRFHVGMWKTPMKRVNAMQPVPSLTASPVVGGDKTLMKLTNDLKALGYLVAPYIDYLSIHPLNRIFHPDLLLLWPTKRWVPSGGIKFLIKPLQAVRLESQYAPKLRAKFGFTAVYSDELGTVPPWGLVDYDSRTPGAGKLKTAFYAHGRLLLNEKRFFNGPVWTEGTAHYFWAGLADVTYGQDRNHADGPTLVDFELLKIHPLQNDTGVDLTQMTKKDLDWKLATQIVYGHVGHLWGKKDSVTALLWHGRASQASVPHVLKSYFMMQQLQSYYAMVPVDAIRYNDGSKLVSTSRAIASGAYKNCQVYTRYQNGLEVYVNRNQQRRWKVAVGGKEYVLPPNGYVACLPGRILEYSAWVDGHRADYVSSPEYTYCDGRRQGTRFGKIAAAHSYVVKRGAAGSFWLIPTPFQKEETITLTGFGTIRKIVPYSEDGRTVSVPVRYTSSAGGVKLRVAPGVFKYELRTMP
ncbi:MAG: hypothetical protein GXP31_09895 [Kiritimatiellaeota bacterium]|nr:hypothetical protein [Kiritimatiellota bacterium]